MSQRKSHFERAQARMPEGYRLDSWRTGTGRTFRVIEISTGQTLISNQKTPGAAVELLKRLLDTVKKTKQRDEPQDQNEEADA